MADNLAFLTTTNEELDMDVPKTLQEVIAATTGTKLLWWELAKLSYGYLPFLVFVNDRSEATAGAPATLMFQFVNCANGDKIAGSFTVAFDNIIVHPGLPSTPLPAAPWPAGREDRVVFLMLNHQAMSEAMWRAAGEANAVDPDDLDRKVKGKWPGGAGDKRLTRAQAAVIELAKRLAAMGHAVSAEELNAALSR